MSAAPAHEPYRDVAALKSFVREASELGVRFRLSGADVVIDGLSGLPPGLQGELCRYRDSGLLWDFLGGEELDLPALDFLDQLGIEAALVETPQQAVPAIRNLLSDARKHDNLVGIDIETSSPLTERPWIAINKDGTLSADQPKLEDKTLE